MSYIVTCCVCGKEFSGISSRYKMCSLECRDKRTRELTGRQVISFKDVHSGTIGAAAEHYVTSELLKHGYAVFRAASPSCFCDIVAIKDGSPTYIEVRIGYKNTRGQFTFGRTVHTNNGTPHIFAIVERNTNEIAFRDSTDWKREVTLF